MLPERPLDPHEEREVSSSRRRVVGTGTADAEHIRALAEFGPPPTNLFATIPYAVLVLVRLWTLRTALSDLARLHRMAHEDSMRALADLGRAVSSANATLPALADRLATVRAASEAAADREAASRDSSAAHEAQRARLLADAEKIEAEAAPYRDRESKLAAQNASRETELRRASARVGRVEIELRNVRATAPDPAREATLLAELEARQAEARLARGQLDELAPELVEIRRELARKLAAADAIRAQIRTLDAVRTRASRVEVSTTAASTRALDEALAALGREVLQHEGGETTDEVVTRNARTLVAVVEARNREIRLHRGATQAYDRRGFLRGISILGSALLVVALTIVIALLR